MAVKHMSDHVGGGWSSAAFEGARIYKMTKDLEGLVAEGNLIAAEPPERRKSIVGRIGKFIMSTMHFLIKNMFVILVCLAMVTGKWNGGAHVIGGVVNAIGKPVAQMVAGTLTGLFALIVGLYVGGIADKATFTLIYYPCFAAIYAFMSLNKGLVASIRLITRQKYNIEMPEKLEAPSFKSSPRQNSSETSVHKIAAARAMKMTKVFTAVIGFFFKANVWLRALHLVSWGWSGYGWFKNWRKPKGDAATQTREINELDALDEPYEVDELDDVYNSSKLSPWTPTPRTTTPRPTTPRTPTSRTPTSRTPTSRTTTPRPTTPRTTTPRTRTTTPRPTTPRTRTTTPRPTTPRPTTPRPTTPRTRTTPDPSRPYISMYPSMTPYSSTHLRRSQGGAVQSRQHNLAYYEKQAQKLMTS